MSEKFERPIGYWLKAADRAITARVDAAHRADDVTRLQWQVLNTIAEPTHCTRDDILETLHMFLDGPTLDTVLNAFRDKGWIVSNAGDEVSLTDAGRQAHARILTRQQEVRQQVMRGISAEDYATTLRVLQRIVENLGEPASTQTS